MPAVVDKDHFSSLLARGLEAHALIISTEADAIYRKFGTENAEAIRRLTVTEARDLDEAGEFPKGSMGPKVEALCQFAEQSGPTAASILCSPGDVLLALRGERGTTISSPS